MPVSTYTPPITLASLNGVSTDNGAGSVGTFNMAMVGAAVNAGNTIVTNGAASTLASVIINSGVVSAGGAYTTGQTWRNVSGRNLAIGDVGMFQRVS